MNYTTSLTPAQLRALRDIFPDSGCITEPEAMLVHGSDTSRIEAMPLAVVRPRNEEQVCRLMRWANAERVPLYPRGRATNTVGAVVPDPAGVVVSTLLMNRICEVNPADFVAVVEPGVITSDFQQHVESMGLFYPPDPASMKFSSIGGNVATCAGGMRALKYGVTREFVLGCRVVLPDGEVINCGGRTHKNVVGLDLTRLMVGSEGTLGIMTQITLKLLPKPEATASVLAGFPTLEAAMNAVSQTFKAGMLPAALEFMGPAVLDCLSLAGAVPWPDSVKAALLYRLDGSADSLPMELQRLRKVLDQCAPSWIGQGMGSEEEEPLWEVRRVISPASFHVAPNKISDDVTVPRGKLLQALHGFDAISERHGLKILTFGHVGDGNIHVGIMHDAEAGQRPTALKAKAEIMDLVISLGGSLSGEHGVGLTKAPHVHKQLGIRERALMSQIKAAFDPNGILNPGKAF